MSTTRLAGIALACALLAGCKLDSRFIYYPQPLNAVQAAAVRMRYPAAAEISLTASDGTRLHGWLLGAEAGRRKPLIIYYGGNAEEASWQIGEAARFSGFAVLLINYRGYGLSGGQPDETALFADALLAYDAITKRAEVDPARVLLWGRSLGTGVAVHVASQRPARGVALVSPYDSMEALSRLHFGSAMTLLLRQRFDSIARAPAIRAPLLAVIGARDTLVPPLHSRRLYDAWGGTKEWVALPQADHNDLTLFPDYWSALTRFFERAAGA